MKSNFFKASLILAAAVVVAAACQKEELPLEQTKEISAQKAQTGRLISATKVETVSAATAIEQAQSKLADSMSELKGSMQLLTASLMGENILDLQIVTYRIKYYSTTVSKGVRKDDSILYGDVSFLVDNTGTISERILESVSLCHTFYSTSSLDVDLGEEFFNLRALYNALVVFPLYQGGDARDGFIHTPSEFILKGKQAIDCELAALELVDSLENVSMMKNYYTENMGTSNGGGPTLAVQYLLESDETDYNCQKYADIIRLRSTLLAEGNCSNKGLFDVILKDYEYGEDAMVDMNVLAPIGYLTTAVGTLKTWTNYDDEYITSNYFEKDYIDSVKIDGVNPYYIYANNSGSTMKLVSGDDVNCPGIKETVNAKLMTAAKDGFDMGAAEVQELYNLFKKNDKIGSGWTPKSTLVFAHSKNDDFLYFDTIFGIWDDLSDHGRNRNVRLETVENIELFGENVVTFDHMVGCFYFLFKDILLKKHPAE